MAKDPAFLFYSSDFLNGITDLTMEERGQYITLICLQHQKGELTDKVIKLNVSNVSKDVLDKFEKLENGNFKNKRLDNEIKKRVKFKGKQSENGSLGGRPPKKEAEINPNNNPKETQTKPKCKPKQKPLENENENENKDIITIEKENETEIINEIFEEEFTELLAEYFLQTTEVQKMRITGFLMSKDIKPQIENFKEQTIAYAKYKKLTGEKIHNWNSYQYEWDREDWIKKLKRETDAKQLSNITGADQEFRDKTAKRLGIIQS